MGIVIWKLKDDNISNRFDTSLLEKLIKQIAELQFKIEKLFIEKTPEEIALEKPSEKEDEKAKYQLTPAQLER
jgi:phosphoenolpyruvate synthase/pyruvate phosphate dikinase